MITGAIALTSSANRRLARIALAASWLGVAGLLAGCSSVGDPARVCLKLEASENLNSVGGVPHVVVVYFYPLQNVLAFQQSDAKELVEGKRPPGLMGERFELTLFPGTERELSESLPRDTLYVGILADFYSGPSKAVAPARCKRFGDTEVVLSGNDVQVRE